MSTRSWLVLGFVLVACGGFACGKIKIDDGKLACGKNRSCPAPLTCLDDMKCHLLDAGTSTHDGGSDMGAKDGAIDHAGAVEGGSTAPSTCPALDNPTGGVVSATVVTAGATATYSCNLGGKLSGPATRTCQGDGTWDGVQPTCASQDCGPLTPPKDGSVMAPTTTFGSVATYSCGAGLGPSGSSTRTCQSDGTWDGMAPACVVANCPSLAGPKGGTVVATTLTFGSTATYACNSGYTIAGMATRTCKPDGTWSDAAPTCTIKDCGALTAPTNGTVMTPAGTAYGASGSFTCAAGYGLSGMATVTCGTDGTWSAAAPTCVPKDCGALTAPTGGAVSATVTTFGSSATYSCNTGYLMSGGATRACGADAQWTGAAPTCALANCGMLTAPTNGSVAAPTTTYGATATYSCTNGYGPSGSATRTCQATGTWDGVAPTCVIANCPSLAGPSGGAVSAPALTFGATATYSCGAGYDLAGVSTRTCQASGAWSGAAPTCTIKNCGALTAPASGAVAATVTTYGATATYTCTAGYGASGSVNRTCQADGTWSGAAPTCTIKNCGALSGPTNGAVSATVTTYGSTATYSCNGGYSVAGAATRTCQADGTWSGAAATCAINDCGGLSPPANGSVSAPTTTYGSTATYACTVGYGASGSATRSCQANGTWSGTAPTCVIANCPALNSPAGGSVTALVLTYGSTATYACNAGYNINGSMSRTCQANGSWSGAAPTCDPKDCGAPGKPVNGTVSASATTYGSVATYGCGGTGSGYTLSGSMTRTCQSDQTWSSAVPTCVPADCGPLSVGNGAVSYSSTTLGAMATYSCNTNYTLSGGGPTVSCLATAKWSATPTCVDVCAVAGNTGTASHCCTNAACPAAAPDCNTTSHTCGAKPLGEGCTGDGQCGSGHCAFGVCCNTACAGTCNQSCNSAGACQAVPASTRKACGTTRSLTQAGFNDIPRRCDGSGNCVGPTIRCGSTPSCSLEVTVCCMTSDVTTPLVISCVPPQQCLCGTNSSCGNMDNQRWYGCTTSLDCPAGKLCAINSNYFGTYGFMYSECRTGIDTSTNWNNEACDPSMPASQCVTGTGCTSFGGSSTDALTGECL